MRDDALLAEKSKAREALLAGAEKINPQCDLDAARAQLHWGPGAAGAELRAHATALVGADSGFLGDAYRLLMRGRGIA